MPFAREASDAGAASVVRRELGWAESPMPSAADLVGLGIDDAVCWGWVGVRQWRCSLPGVGWACGISNAIPGGKAIGVGGTVPPGIDGFGQSGSGISAVWLDRMARYARFA